MSLPERTQELIQKYLDLAASELELAELEQLLASDSEIAHAFAEMARLHANLQSHFRKQYKIDQVAALLDASDAPARPRAYDAPPRCGVARPVRCGLDFNFNFTSFALQFFI